MANRLWVFLSVLTLAGCSARNPEAPELPKSISPGWRLSSFTSADPLDAPVSVKSAHLLAAWKATYTGPGSARVRVWAIPDFAAGLNLVQTWIAEPNTVVLNSDHYFAKVDWSGTDRAQAGTLVRAVERSLGHISEH